MKWSAGVSPIVVHCIDAGTDIGGGGVGGGSDTKFSIIKYLTIIDCIIFGIIQVYSNLISRNGIILKCVVPGGMKVNAIITIEDAVFIEDVLGGVAELDADFIVRYTGVVDKGIVPGGVKVDTKVIVRAAIVDEGIIGGVTELDAVFII